MKTTIYTDGQYLENNPTWGAEDSLWKAKQIYKIIKRNNLRFQKLADLGCGAGVILDELSRMIKDKDVSFKGYDMSPQAIELAKKIDNNRISFHLEDLLSDTNNESFDILLIIDIFEHVPDYISCVEKCRRKSKYKIYHIPLDIHVSSVLRNAFIKGRRTVGHLHYFTADSAIATLRDTGHKIIDSFYTDLAFGLFKVHPTFRKAIANIPRWLFSKFSLPFTARVFGGYSLLVLAE